MSEPKHSFFESAARTFAVESSAIEATSRHIQENSKSFEHACSLLLKVKGRVIVMGVGKSGHIANKIASTLSSTGTPAIFLHPSEAAHGDMGMVLKGDVLIVLSKSGASEELFLILPSLQRIDVPIIAITAQPASRLAEAARKSHGEVLLIDVPEEACPHDLAPTASTTAALVLGDALAIALLEARKFSSDDFARLHPAGALGKKLTFAVKDLMATEDAIPTVNIDTGIQEVMLEMSRKRFGATAVLNADRTLAGIITDGDLRRAFQTEDALHLTATEIMTRNPKVARGDMLAIDAIHFMEDSTPTIMQLLVVRDDNTLEGIVHLHDFVKAGIN